MRAYLDNAATTRACPEAVEAAAKAMDEMFFNPSSPYGPALAVKKRLDAARLAVADTAGMGDAGVVFTSGGTEANNLAIMGAMARGAGGGMLTCSAEHVSVLDAARRLSARELAVDENGVTDLDALRDALRASPGLRLVSLMHVNNETGAILPVGEAARLIKEHTSALFHVDGVQAFLHTAKGGLGPVDLYTISGHKVHAPKGVAALITGKAVRLKPIFAGGGQEGGVRAGTENTPGIMALAAAVACHDPCAVDRMAALKQRLYEGIMDAYPDALVNGPDPAEAAAHILNVSFPGILGETLTHALEGEGVYVSMGSACMARRPGASHVLTAMGLGKERISSALRFSLCRYTTRDEIDMAIDAIRRHAPVLRKFVRR